MATTAQRTEIDPAHRVFDEVLPARGRLAFQVYAGQVLRIIDVEGK